MTDRGQGLLSFRMVRKMFEVYIDSFNNFKDQYYLITPTVARLLKACAYYQMDVL